MEFHERWFSSSQILDPQIALDAWDDVNQYELFKARSRESEVICTSVTITESPNSEELLKRSRERLITLI